MKPNWICTDANIWSVRCLTVACILDKSALLRCEQVAGRLCMALVEDPAGARAERACLLLAAVANTLAHAPAYMRLYEPAAEAMPLRLEQVKPKRCIRLALVI